MASLSVLKKVLQSPPSFIGPAPTASAMSGWIPRTEDHRCPGPLAWKTPRQHQYQLTPDPTMLSPLHQTTSPDLPATLMAARLTTSRLLFPAGAQHERAQGLGMKAARPQSQASYPPRPPGHLGKERLSFGSMPARHQVARKKTANRSTRAKAMSKLSSQLHQLQHVDKPHRRHRIPRLHVAARTRGLALRESRFLLCLLMVGNKIWYHDLCLI